MPASADAGGVDEDDLAATPRQARVDGVAGRARDVRHDRALLAEERVEQAGLADVGPADEGDGRRSRLGLGGDGRIPLGRLGLLETQRGGVLERLGVGVDLVGGTIGRADDVRLQAPGQHLVGPRLRLRVARLAGEFLLALGRQGPHDRVEQVAGPAAVRRRDGVDLVPAERVELHALELALLVVGLVDGHDHRCRGTAEQVGGLRVRRRHAGGRIDHEDDDVRLVDGEARLFLDARLDRIVGIDLEPAGVHDDEPAAVPLGVAVEAVASRPRTVLDDRRPMADDAVEERALADVGPTDDGDDRERPAEARRRRAGSLVGRPRSGRAGGWFGRRQVRERGRSTGRRGGALQGGGGQFLRPRPRVRGAGDLQDVLGHVAQVLDRRRRAAGDPDDAGLVEDGRRP